MIYSNLLKKYLNSTKIIKVIDFTYDDEYENDYMLLDEEINYDNNYDDTIISDKYGMCIDLYKDDSLIYDSERD